MSTLKTTIGEVGNLVERSLRLEMKAMIKAKLLESVDQVVEDMAIEIANNIVVHVESMQTHDSFGPQTNVVVNFNLKEPPMVYDTKTKQIRRRDIVER